MGRPKLYSAEELLNKKREAQRKANKKYYDANAEMLREKKRVKKGTGKHKDVIMVDIKTGDEFEYESVRECSEDMSIDIYRINMGLTKGIIYNGYKFKRREDI